MLLSCSALTFVFSQISSVTARIPLVAAQAKLKRRPVNNTPLFNFFAGIPVKIGLASLTNLINHVAGEVPSAPVICGG